MKTAIALLAAALSVAALSSNAFAQRLTANIGGAAGPKLSSSSVAERNGMNGVSLKDTGVVGFNPQPQPPGKSNSSALSMGTNYGDVMTRAENNVDYDVTSSEILVKTHCTGYCVHADQGADTSFGTRSGGGFKLASEPAGVQEEWYDTGPFKLGSVTEEENPNDSPRPEKELIWLLGYPGSGTNEIMDVVEQATGETGATNYGDSLAREDDPMMAGRCEAAPNYSLAGEGIPCWTEFFRVKGNIPTRGFDTTLPDTTPPSPATAMEYGLIASLIEGDPDRPDPTSVVAPTVETQGSNVATEIEYGLIASLIGIAIHSENPDTANAIPVFLGAKMNRFIVVADDDPQIASFDTSGIPE
jgi:hypothetical protein